MMLLIQVWQVAPQYRLSHFYKPRTMTAITFINVHTDCGSIYESSRQRDDDGAIMGQIQYKIEISEQYR